MRSTTALSIILLIRLVFCSDSELTVRVKNGLLQGKYMETRSGSRIFGFIGIPYAKPPLGELRFQPPAPLEDWDGVKPVNAEMHPFCPQINILVKAENVEGEEDCLFLNVYTPKIDKDHLLPVMVYIHGGGFHSGGALLHGPEYLLDKDVILVTMNYRLGTLGFISTGDDLVPGNMGMKDQSFALKWTKENIINFGGDPNSITIFGESAGAASTHLQVLSPLNKGLIHAAISQSGNALGRWAHKSQQEVVGYTKTVAGLVNCPTGCSKEMVECLRKVDFLDLIKAQVKMLVWDLEPSVMFAPVIEPKHEGAFMYETPEKSIELGLGSDIPWLTGITTDEGVLRSGRIVTSPNLLNTFNEKLEEYMNMIMFMEKSRVTQKIGKSVREFYFANGNIDASKERNLTNLYTDAYFLESVSRAIDLHKKYSKSPVYNYLFGFRGSMSHSEVFSGSTADFGVCHCDELLYLFPIHTFVLPGKKPTSDDEKMIDLLITLWTNFAKYRNPTPDNSAISWKPVETTEKEYLHIAQDQSATMDKGMFKERVAFWNKMEELIRAGDKKDEL